MIQLVLNLISHLLVHHLNAQDVIKLVKHVPLYLFVLNVILVSLSLILLVSKNVLNKVFMVIPQPNNVHYVTVNVLIVLAQPIPNVLNVFREIS